jgi:hypothetical protein
LFYSKAAYEGYFLKRFSSILTGAQPSLSIARPTLSTVAPPRHRETATVEPKGIPSVHLGSMRAFVARKNGIFYIVGNMILSLAVTDFLLALDLLNNP